MIHKIERLVSIGKFRNYQAAGQVNFHKLTVIYGDNGGGKTTLTSVLRSLANNNPEIVRSRISTNHTAAQAGQIICRDTPNPDSYHTFNANGWTVPYANFEFFDIHFVNENVYSGFDFTDDHKKQLHQFVIGAQGIAIQQQVEQNKIAKATSRINQTAFENQLFQQVSNGLSSGLIAAFLTIPTSQANNIDQQIAVAEASLASANSNTVIQTLQRLSQLSTINPGCNFSELEADLQLTASAIQDTALKTLFDNHCRDLAENNIDAAEPWLQTGFSYLESKHEKSEDGNPQTLTCPFCLQIIGNNIEIIKAYASQFNEEFNSLVQRMQDHLVLLQAFNIDSVIQALNTINQTNTVNVTSWSVHLPATVQAPVFNVIADEAIFRAELNALIATVQQKIQNPSVAVSLSSMTTLRDTIQNVNTNIDAYNLSIRTYNAGITRFLTGIQTVSQAQEEVQRLKRIKKRFETPIATLCTQLKTERQNLRGLETAYTQLVQQQETAATAFFTNYKDRINHYLGNIFKTLFRIDNVVHVPPQGRATHSKIGYKLTIDGKDISFTANQPFSAKECLSEGDKSTIALAFFLSKLDLDANKQDKILVFDDPLSSLDTNRRTYTVGIIKSLFPQMRQIVVLSHNEHFLHEICGDFGQSEKKTLRITENFAAKESKLELCDLEELVKNEYFKQIEALEEFRVNPVHANKDTVLGWLRNVLESHLRFKFYKEIRGMSGIKTFGRLIAFLKTSTVVFRDNGNRANIIANLNLINSVSWKPHHGDPMPNYSTLGINPNSITASELDNLIQDTLNMVENQL
jgi:wobble nucleotide-excising tRNase